MSKDTIIKNISEHSDEIIGTITGSSISLVMFVHEIIHLAFAILGVAISVSVSVLVKHYWTTKINNLNNKKLES